MRVILLQTNMILNLSSLLLFDPYRDHNRAIPSKLIRGLCIMCITDAFVVTLLVVMIPCGKF